jgi:hypothetical protein
VYLGLVFFIDSLYIQLSTDLKLPASGFPHFNPLPHPTSLKLPELGISFIDRYQHFGGDCCILLLSRRVFYPENPVGSFVTLAPIKLCGITSEKAVILIFVITEI